MICKNCYHSDICGFEGCYDDALTFCKEFKDKSRIIELPCKVGKTLYCVSYDDSIQPFVEKYENISLVNMLTLMAALENPASRVVLLTGNKNEAEARLKEIENDRQRACI
jgi:hypothetical protein